MSEGLLGSAEPDTSGDEAPFESAGVDFTMGEESDAEKERETAAEKGSEAQAREAEGAEEEKRSLLSESARAEAKRLEGKPDWLPKKYWKVEGEKGQADVEGLAKSYAALERRMSQGVPADAGAYLKNYDPAAFAKAAKLPDGVTVPASDPLLAAFGEAALSAGLKPEQFDKVAAHIAGKLGRGEVLLDGMPGPIDEAAELKKLGENGAVIVESVAGRLKALRQSGAMTEDEAKMAQSIGATAEGVSLLRALLSAGSAEIPGGNPIPARSGTMSEAEFHKAVASDKWDEDPAYRARVRAMRANSRSKSPGTQGFSVDASEYDPFAEEA